MRDEAQARSLRSAKRTISAWARSVMSGSLMFGALCLLSPEAVSSHQGQAQADSAQTLEKTRLALGKWIETEQIISRERSDWQRGKEVLSSRIELVQQEVAALEKSMEEAQSSVAAANKEREELLAESHVLEAASAQLTEGVTRMEDAVRNVFPILPDPIQAKLQPLFQRMPRDAADARVSIAERFQNALGILNDLNKANNEITVNYEVHTLADGKPSEVKAIYVGLAQAYYVSSGGEAGIGCPTSDGWKWEPAGALANDVLVALEILQGTHTPAFVLLPVKVR